jgi:nitroimidazol reductase NimA-like FMN-containing flavoprotein (pyridoxamine 5'-phosphate oxidase superfamily)
MQEPVRHDHLSTSERRCQGNNPIEDLAESACLELLRGHPFGRVAFIEHADGPPAIMPVNYLMHGEAVVFRTDPKSKLG